MNIWDTSALAKLYLPERGSAWALSASRSGIVTSSLAIPEIASVFGRRWRQGQFDAAERDRLYGRFLDDARRFLRIQVDDEVLSAAGNFLLDGATMPILRANDAIHVAGAKLWFERAEQHSIEAGMFIVADGRLREVARAAGLPVENPEDYA